MIERIKVAGDPAGVEGVEEGGVAGPEAGPEVEGAGIVAAVVVAVVVVVPVVVSVAVGEEVLVAVAPIVLSRTVQQVEEERVGRSLGNTMKRLRRSQHGTLDVLGNCSFITPETLQKA